MQIAAGGCIEQLTEPKNLQDCVGSFKRGLISLQIYCCAINQAFKRRMVGQPSKEGMEGGNGECKQVFIYDVMCTSI